MKRDEDECPKCFGIGQLVEVQPVRFGQPLRLPPPCPACDGTGIRPKPKPVPTETSP